MTREEAGLVRRVKTRLMTKERQEFASSSNPNKKYSTIVLTNGQLQCDCQGWTVKKPGRPRQCKHVFRLARRRALVTDPLRDLLYLMQYAEVDMIPYNPMIESQIFRKELTKHDFPNSKEDE